jgi:alkylhydroperoxidase family enzyme
MSTSLDQQMVDAALGDLDLALASELLSPATIMALRLADVLTSDDPVVSSDLKTELGAHFDDGQILELGSALAVASGWQRFIEAFGIRPDHWSPGDELPHRPGA